MIDLNAPVKANLEAVAKALGETVSDVTAVDPRPRPPRRHHPRVPRGRRPHPPHPRRRRRRRDLGRVAQLRHRHPVRHRRHARRRHRRVRARSASAARSRAGSGRATTRSARAALDAGYDLDKVLMLDDLVARRRLLLRRHRHHRRRAAAGRALLGRRREHAEPRDALEVGHDPHHRRAAPLDEAERVLRRQVQLITAVGRLQSAAFSARLDVMRVR